MLFATFIRSFSRHSPLIDTQTNIYNARSLVFWFGRTISTHYVSWQVAMRSVQLAGTSTYRMLAESSCCSLRLSARSHGTAHLYTPRRIFTIQDRSFLDFAIRYPAACGKSRHRASPACSVAIVQEGIAGILNVRWDIHRERPPRGLSRQHLAL